jgi:hypothetical protein
MSNYSPVLKAYIHLRIILGNSSDNTVNTVILSLQTTTNYIYLINIISSTHITVIVLKKNPYQHVLVYFLLV